MYYSSTVVALPVSELVASVYIVEKTFELMGRVNPRNHLLDGAQNTLRYGADFGKEMGRRPRHSVTIMRMWCRTRKIC